MLPLLAGGRPQLQPQVTLHTAHLHGQLPVCHAGTGGPPSSGGAPSTWGDGASVNASVNMDSPRSACLQQMVSATPGQSGDHNGPGREKLGFERRLAWLEEDVSVLQRRLRDECHVEASLPGVAGEAGLRQFVAALDGELAADRRTSQEMQMKLAQLEESIVAESAEREAQLRGFSAELEGTMRSLISRIDEALSQGANAMRERADQTETKLKNLIRRVDDGLSFGAMNLQDTVNSAAQLFTPTLNELSAAGPAAFAGAKGQSSQGGMDKSLGKSPEQLLQMMERMRYDSATMRNSRGQSPQRSPQAPQTAPVQPQMGTAPTASPLGMPFTAQVPGSGLAASPDPGIRAASPMVRRMPVAAVTVSQISTGPPGGSGFPGGSIGSFTHR